MSRGCGGTCPKDLPYFNIYKQDPLTSDKQIYGGDTSIVYGERGYSDPNDYTNPDAGEPASGDWVDTKQNQLTRFTDQRQLGSNIAQSPGRERMDSTEELHWSKNICELYAPEKLLEFLPTSTSIDSQNALVRP